MITHTFRSRLAHDPGRSLRRRRRWFAAGDDATATPNDPAPDDTGDASPSAETENTDTGHMIPKTRFDEVNAKAKQHAAELEKVRSELDEFKAQQSKAEQDRLKKQGEFQTLYEQEQAKAAQLDAQIKENAAQIERYKGVVDKMLEHRKASLPDHIKPLIDNMDPIAALAYLTENADKFGQVEAEPEPQPSRPKPPPMHSREGLSVRDEPRTVTLNKRAKL